jgi:hypothetical protein
MRLFSYVVARDYGFAPNPFHGFCTLATCKPEIRRHAAIGDWIAGVASKSDREMPGLIYVMRVDHEVTFNEYWDCPRYQVKKPSHCGSLKQVFGDNIYHRSVPNGQWTQADSHHSLENGAPNPRNINNDTQTDRVLIGHRFVYWGSDALDIPNQFLDFDGKSLCVGRGYKSNFPLDFVEAFINWFESLQLQGCLGRPYRWRQPGARWTHPRP